MSDWSDSDVATLRKLFAEGLSMTVIAKRLGRVSRSSVIGKAHRLGLVRSEQDKKIVARAAAPASTPRQRPAPRPPAPKMVATKPATPKPALKLAGSNAVFEEGPPREARVPPPKNDAFQPLPGSQPRPWEEWEVGLCRWPIDSMRVDPLRGDPTRACCLPAIREGNAILPYCPQHLAVSGAGRTASQPRTEAQRQGDIARAEKARARMARRFAA